MHEGEEQHGEADDASPPVCRQRHEYRKEVGGEKGPESDDGDDPLHAEGVRGAKHVDLDLSCRENVGQAVARDDGAAKDEERAALTHDTEEVRKAEKPG